MAQRDLPTLLGLRLPEALRRVGAGQQPIIVRTAPPRPREPLPTEDACFRIVRVDALVSPPVWVVAASFDLPESNP